MPDTRALQMTAKKAIESLRNSGQPPKLGASTLNVGTDHLLAELRKKYLEDHCAAINDGEDGGGTCKWAEADYGNGKTQFLRCFQEMAWECNFVVGYVELSQDESPLDRPERVFSAVARSLQAQPNSPADVDRTRGLNHVLAQLLDRKFQGVLSGLPDDGLRADALDWVQQSLRSTPVESSALATAATVYLTAKLKGESEREEISKLYLRGDPIPQPELRKIGVFERLDRTSAFRLLRSVTQLLQRSGLANGTVLLFDEARRTLSLMSTRNQLQACENLLSVINHCNNGDFPGTMFLYAVMTKFQHDRFGECEFVRIEGVDWIVRCCDSGQLYRVPLSRRHDSIPIGATCPMSPEVGQPAFSSDNALDDSSTKQPDAGGLNQLLRAIRTGNQSVELTRLDAVKRPTSISSQRPNPEDKPKPSFDIDVHFRPDAHPSQQHDSEDVTVPAPSFEVESPAIAHPVVVEPSSVSTTLGIQNSEKRRLRRVFESLRNGLSPIHVDSRPFAVGIEDIQKKAANLLEDVAMEGGRAVVIRGAYGQGKTFCLQLLQQVALERGFVVASTEINAQENPLDKPHMVYRSLMRQLRFPDGGIQGVRGLVLRTCEQVRRLSEHCRSDFQFSTEARRLLEEEIQCRPLAWMFSDARLLEKPHLIDVLACNPGVEVYPARLSHVLEGQPRDWPAFSAGTQGDLGSYLLSGIARLSRFLGYKGLILVLDEMEKWQDLNWVAQCRAGNLLGGLIWSASAEHGKRKCNKITRDCDHPDLLKHSTRCGGSPFSTEDRCFLGLAIAMTPRGDDGPEQLWSEYGLLEIVDLPAFTRSHVKSYVSQIFPSYCRGYDVQQQLPAVLSETAIKRWRQSGDGSTRTAVQAVMATLDEWRESLIPQEA